MIGYLRREVERCEVEVRRLKGTAPKVDDVEAQRLRWKIEDLEARLAGFEEDLEKVEWPIRDLRLAEEALSDAWSKLKEAEKEAVS